MLRYVDIPVTAHMADSKQKLWQQDNGAHGDSGPSDQLYPARRRGCDRRRDPKMMIEFYWLCTAHPGINGVGSVRPAKAARRPGGPGWNSPWAHTGNSNRYDSDWGTIEKN